eukprot:scaffold45390_cov28-Cyclotella_meneghiniana.AAC.1
MICAICTAAQLIISYAGEDDKRFARYVGINIRFYVRYFGFAQSLHPLTVTVEDAAADHHFLTFSHEVAYELTPMVSDSPMSKYSSLGMDEIGHGVATNQHPPQ